METQTLGLEKPVKKRKIKAHKCSFVPYVDKAIILDQLEKQFGELHRNFIEGMWKDKEFSFEVDTERCSCGLTKLEDLPF